MPLHPIGAEVHIDPAIAHRWPPKAMAAHSTFVVEQLPIGRRTSYLLRHATARAILLKARPEQILAGPHPGGFAAVVEAVPTILDPGTVAEHDRFPGLWVVTGWTAKGHTIYPLGGGDRGRKWVPATSLTVVTLDLGQEEASESA